MPKKEPFSLLGTDFDTAYNKYANLQMAVPFISNFFYIQLRRFIIKATEKVIATRKKAKDKKLSKWALWWQKNPQGLDVIIHDMRAVMR